MFTKKLLVLLAALLLVLPLVFLQGCSQDENNPVESDISDDVGNIDNQLPDLTMYNPADRIENEDGKRQNGSMATANCSWWNSLGRNGRNYQIVLEALYSVDRHIWDQNNRVTCWWSRYLSGIWGCYVPGDWRYRYYSPDNGYSGQCKPFVREILERASGGAASLPGNDQYDYRNWYPYRNRADGIRYAQPGEVMQFTGSRLHTAIVITNFHDGRFEVVDGNYCVSDKIAKHVINVNIGDEKNADLKFYVIDCY